MKRFRLLIYLFSLMTISVSFPMCSGDDAPEYTFPEGDDKPEPPISKYPTGVSVVEFTDNLGADKKCIGFVATIDLKANSKLRFNTVLNDVSKVPSKMHADFKSAGKGTPIVTINGGYAWAGQSLSLLIVDGKVKSIENQTVSRKDADNNSVNVYAVRSSFGQTAASGFETKWIYCVLDDGNKPYAFPSPLDNDEKTKTYMAAPPTSQTAGATLWTPQQAIGGGPMLVQNSANVADVNYWKEVFDGGGIAGLSRQPRTAIGATADGKIIMLVCDGRGMRGSAGFTLSELADKLISLGVVNAINLDGGGSSAIIGIDGVVLNRPSETGDSEAIVERAVSTGVVISQIQ